MTFRSDAFPHQFPQPLERLNVYDGLIMTAERWEVSQAYFRQRDNLHFQAMGQSGIVCGLGVKVIDPPPWSRAQTRARDAQRSEQRWLEIQPGVAIDVAGNPIIVGQGDERDRAFRVAIAPPTAGPVTVYITARYVEPFATAAANGQDTLPEQCRFEELTAPPDPLDIELCRFQLGPGPVRLASPQDLFVPRLGELDLRHRQVVQTKPIASPRVGFVNPTTAKTYDDFHRLNQAMAVLLPEMQLDLAAHKVQLHNSLPVDAFDILYMSYAKARDVQLLMPHLQWLEAFTQKGGVILLETPSAQVPKLPPRMQQVFQTLVPWQDLKATHPIKTEPFLFTQLPKLGGNPVNLAIADGLVWLGGDLSSAWGLQRPLPRADIRTAHELGINVLRHLWRRRHLMGLLQWQTPVLGDSNGAAEAVGG